MKPRSIAQAICFLFVVLPAAFAEEVPVAGKIWNYNKAIQELTVIQPVPGFFRKGETIIIYNPDSKLETGNAVVTEEFHTKVYARPQKDLNISRNDIAVHNVRDMLKYFKLPPQAQIVSFREVGAPARGWVVKVNYQGLTCTPEDSSQTRKINISNSIGVRVDNESHYTPVKAGDVRFLMYEWDGTVLQGKTVMLKNNARFNITDILEPEIARKLTPPSSCKTEPQKVVVTLEEGKAAYTRRTDAIDLHLDSRLAKKTFKQNESFYLVQVYSNSRFLDEYLVTPDDLASGDFDAKYQLPGYYLAYGQNKLEFFAVEAEPHSSVYFEKSELVKIGETTLQFDSSYFSNNKPEIEVGK